MTLTNFSLFPKAMNQIRVNPENYSLFLSLLQNYSIPDVTQLAFQALPSNFNEQDLFMSQDNVNYNTSLNDLEMSRFATGGTPFGYQQPNLRNQPPNLRNRASTLQQRLRIRRARKSNWLEVPPAEPFHPNEVKASQFEGRLIADYIKWQRAYEKGNEEIRGPPEYEITNCLGVPDDSNFGSYDLFHGFNFATPKRPPAKLPAQPLDLDECEQSYNDMRLEFELNGYDVDIDEPQLPPEPPLLQKYFKESEFPQLELSPEQIRWSNERRAITKSVRKVTETVSSNNLNATSIQLELFSVLRLLQEEWPE